MTIPVEIKVLDDDLEVRFGLPTYGTEGSAAIDLMAAEDATVKPGQTILIPTGIAIHIKDTNYCAMILPRSGLGHKQGLVLGNGTGLIDSDYQGQLFVSAFNRNPVVLMQRFQSATRKDEVVENNRNAVNIRRGDRIAQLIFVPVAHAVFERVEDFDESKRGIMGFGSTGTSKKSKSR